MTPASTAGHPTGRDTELTGPCFLAGESHLAISDAYEHMGTNAGFPVCHHCASMLTHVPHILLI